jgi:ArsR family transcriptional regulator
MISRSWCTQFGYKSWISWAALPIKQPTVSHHLRLLREAGLIDCERQGLLAYYFVQREAVAALRSRIAGQLDALN